MRDQCAALALMAATGTPAAAGVHRHGQFLRRLLPGRHHAGPARPAGDHGGCRRAAALPSAGARPREPAGVRQPVRRERRDGGPGARAQERELRPFIVSVTNGLDNSLAGAADLALDTRAGDELGPSTMTFGATLVVMAAVAMRIRRRAAMAADDEGAARACAQLLADPERDAASLLDVAGRAVDAGDPGPRRLEGGRRDGRADAQGGRPLSGRVAADGAVPARPAGAGRAAAGGGRDRLRAARRWSSTCGSPATCWRPAARCW